MGLTHVHGYVYTEVCVCHHDCGWVPTPNVRWHMVRNVVKAVRDAVWLRGYDGFGFNTRTTGRSFAVGAEVKPSHAPPVLLIIEPCHPAGLSNLNPSRPAPPQSQSAVRILAAMPCPTCPPTAPPPPSRRGPAHDASFSSMRTKSAAVRSGSALLFVSGTWR